jgi:hypothetical protein
MKAVTLLTSSFCHASDVYVAADLLGVSRELASSCHLVCAHRFQVRRREQLVTKTKAKTTSGVGGDGDGTYFQCARFASVKAVLSVAVLVSCNEVPWLSA